MVCKKSPNANFAHSNDVELTDERQGAGKLVLVATVQNYVYNQTPRPAWPDPGYHNWSWGHYEYDDWVVRGESLKNRYFQPTFALKLYPDGFILPASLDAATKFATKEEAAALAEKWIAAGCPGIGLESPAETRRRELEERSAAMYPQVSKMLASLTDEDLLRVAEAAHTRIAKRAETEAKEAARAAERVRKAAEKARVAEEKRQKAAQKAAEKARKDEEKAQKAAERARKAEEKAQKQAAKDVLAQASAS